MQESTGNRDGEPEAIWKVISSLNTVYLFINERKVFSEPGRHKKKKHLCLVHWSVFQSERTDPIHRLFLHYIHFRWVKLFVPIRCSERLTACSRSSTVSLLNTMRG